MALPQNLSLNFTFVLLNWGSTRSGTCMSLQVSIGARDGGPSWSLQRLYVPEHDLLYPGVSQEAYQNVVIFSSCQSLPEAVNHQLFKGYLDRPTTLP